MQTPPAIVTPAPAASPAAAPWIAAPRPWAKPAWFARHDQFVARARQGGIDVLFLGDSITAFFETRASSVWNEVTATLGSVANFGISGDRTQFVLWRINHGELDGCGARVVVLLVGTNNLEAASVDGVARGIAANVAAIREKLPNAIVVLNALFPRGTPDDPLRAKLAEVNARIKSLADGEHIVWLDAGAGFLDADGRIPPALMADGLHPTPAGYEVWASALRPVLEEELSK